MTSSFPPLSTQLRVGSCAWSFEDWRGVFYPAHLGSNHWLEFYSRFFNSVEIDSSFYAVPSAHAAAHWLNITPDEFVFSLKLPRAITHERKLLHCQELLTEFLNAISPLRPKLGCILVQLPPYFVLKHDELALREFVLGLPREFRFAIEFRDPSWHLPRIAHLLQDHGVCWVWHDISPLGHAAEGAFESLSKTTDFLYVRLLGDLTTKYGGDGSRRHRYQGLLWPRDASLDSWALRIKQVQAEVARVFIYANNHFEGFGPHTAQRIAQRLGVGLGLPSAADLSGPKPPDSQQLELL